MSFQTISSVRGRMGVFPKCNARLNIIQDIYSQRAIRLKTVEIYCDFCCEDLVFSKVCFDNFLFSNLIKEFWNNLVYTSHFTYVKFHCIYACFGSVNMTFKVALKYS